MDPALLEALTKLDVGEADLIVTPSGEWAEEAEQRGYVVTQHIKDDGFRLWEIHPGDPGPPTLAG